MIAQKLAALCTQQPEDLSAYLYTVGPELLADTQVSSRCHFLCKEGSGEPRVNGLARLLGSKVIDYAVPRSQLEYAKKQLIDTGSAAGFVNLTKKAQSLFTHIEKTGEGGELLLYILAEAYLRVPQVISKMYLKTNAHVHYHGVDGVHASVDPNTGMLALWWGESKLYSHLSAGIDSCLASISPFLIPDAPEGSAIERDVDLLQAYADLSDPELVEAFKHYLDPDDPFFNKVQYRGICLVGFDLEEYPHPESGDPLKFSVAIEEQMAKWRDSMRGSVQRHKLEGVVLEVFFVPVPSVEKLREAFLMTLGIAR